ncbi:hypothetical protein JCM9533A_36990 [Catenuloplanes niger JCM 9533]
MHRDREAVAGEVARQVTPHDGKAGDPDLRLAGLLFAHRISLLLVCARSSGPTLPRMEAVVRVSHRMWDGYPAIRPRPVSRFSSPLRRATVKLSFPAGNGEVTYAERPGPRSEVPRPPPTTARRESQMAKKSKKDKKKKDKKNKKKK